MNSSHSFIRRWLIAISLENVSWPTAVRRVSQLPVGQRLTNSIIVSI